MLFGSNKQYRIWNIYLPQEGNLIFQGNVLIPDGENYQIILTTIEDTPSTITVSTADGTFMNPRDNSANQLHFTLTDAQRAAFLNKAFGIIVLPVVGDDTNPIGLDSNEILSVINGKQFFRGNGSSMVELNGTAYYTRENGKPLKVYGTTRNFNDVSFNINQPYLREHICVSSGQNQFQRIVPSESSVLNSSPFNLTSLAEFTAYANRVCGNKYLRWRGKTLQTSEITLGSSGELDNRGNAAVEESRISYLNSILDAEAIPAYSFKFLFGGKVVIGDRVEFDLSEAISTSLVNYDTFPRITVLDYPTNFVPDVTKSDEQNLNTLRETILQTKLLVYTNPNRRASPAEAQGKAHIITFTRDKNAEGAIPLFYEPATENVSTAFNITTPTSPQGQILGGLAGIDRHLAYGLNSDGIINEFGARSPLYAKVQTMDMNLGDSVRGIQVDRDSNHLWALNIRRVGDPRLPTGSNTIFDLAYYTVNKETAAVSEVRTNHPIQLSTFSPKLGYWAEPNSSSIRTVLDVPSLMEDRDNISLIENLGIEPPPRGEDDEPLKILGFTPFNPQNLTFPSNIDVNLSSNYRSVQTGGGESTRSARAYEREVYEDPINLIIRLVIDEKQGAGNQKVARDYRVTLDDEAISQTSKDECRQKGSIFSRRIECRRTTTTLVRQGINVDLENYYGDNRNAHPIEVVIGFEKTDPTTNQTTVTYRQLPGKLTNSNRSITTPNFITYDNETNLSIEATHERRFNREVGTEYAESARAVTESRRVRYAYTYFNANRNIESAESKYTDELAVSSNDPVDIEGFVIPTDPQVTDIRLYRTCPDFGETAPTLIQQLPLNHIDGSTLPEITTVDELTRADLGGLVYNAERQLIYNNREYINPDLTPDPNIDSNIRITPVVIVNSDGTRHNLNDGFDEQWNRYINSNARILDSTKHLAPPPHNSSDESLLGHIKHLEIVKGTMVGIIGNRIHWSMTGFPDYWPAENFLSFDGEVTGLIEIANGLLAFTRNETHLISNFPPLPNQLPDQTRISDKQGCVHIRTPKFIRGIPIWISSEGICTFTSGGLTATSDSTRQNGKVELLSRGLLEDGYLDGNIITTEVHNDRYFILYNDRIVSMDHRYVTALQSEREIIPPNFVEYSVGNIRHIEVFDDNVLYGITTDNTVVEMFGSETEELSMFYKSALITFDNEEQIKRFGDLYVAYTNRGDLTLTAEFVSSKAPNKTQVFNLPADRNVIEAKMPHGTWYGVQFTVRGKGEISAFGFTAFGGYRKNTKGGGTPE